MLVRKMCVNVNSNTKKMTDVHNRTVQRHLEKDKLISYTFTANTGCGFLRFGIYVRGGQ